MQSQDNPLIERTLKNLASGMSAIILSLGLLVVFNRFAPSAIGSPLWLLHTSSILLSSFGLTLVIRQAFRNKRLLAIDTYRLGNKAVDIEYRLRVAKLRSGFFTIMVQLLNTTNMLIFRPELLLFGIFVLAILVVVNGIHILLLRSSASRHGVDSAKVKQQSSFSALSEYSVIYFVGMLIFAVIIMFSRISMSNYNSKVSDSFLFPIMAVLGFGCTVLELRRILKVTNDKQETLNVVGEAKAS